MKTIIPSIGLLLIIGLGNVQAANGGDELTPSKKNTAVVQNILSDRLPVRLLSPIKKNYKNYWITDLNKTTSNGKTSYCITMENPDKKITMSATASKNWSVTRVITKDAL
jgi:hypothetical protein